jgi:hypothetical protein
MPEVTLTGFHPNKQEEKKPIVFLQKGVTTLRILPAYSEHGIWCFEVREHSAYVNGKFSPQICLGKENGCPWCLEGERLYNLGGEANIERAKDLRPRRNYLFNAIFMNGPEEKLNPQSGVMVLKAGVKVKRQIFDLDSDVAGGYGDVTNVETGFDLRITRTGNGRNDTEYQVKAIPERTSLAANLEAAGFSGEIKPHDLSKVLTPGDLAFAKQVFADNQASNPSAQQAQPEPQPIATDVTTAPPPSPVHTQNLTPPPPPPITAGDN